ncbi:MAG TPA: hypothetical protein VFO49_15170 [Nocardioides sp.]|nr:hypothetical protein [Nocardioides sp.]
MRKIATFAAPALLAALLTVGPGAGTVVADEGPCLQQQAQVTKAEDALARVTAVFERQQAKVKKAKDELAEAETKGERSKAAKKLESAMEKKTKAKKAKKAQQMRLQKAQQRLADCLAAQEPTT